MHNGIAALKRISVTIWTRETICPEEFNLDAAYHRLQYDKSGEKLRSCLFPISDRMPHRIPYALTTYPTCCSLPHRMRFAGSSQTRAERFWLNLLRLLRLHIGIDGTCGTTSGTHRQNHRRGTRHGITARKDAFAGRTALFVGLEATPTIGLKSCGR